MSEDISRRGLLTATGAGALIAAAGAVPSHAETKVTAPAFFQKADLPPAKGPRVVVVGGGWSGLIAAKAIRRDAPDASVVLIEKRPAFFSCPLSNLWLIEKLPMETLLHSYLDAAKANGYIYFNAAVVDIDRQSRTLYTSAGTVSYDFLILAPGVDYDYASVGVTDAEHEYELRGAYPAAFKPGSEHITLRNKLAKFERGIFLLSVPDGNYRCLTAPYERACLIANYFKRNKIVGKVVLLDANPQPQFAADAMFTAAREFYPGIIEHFQGAQITGVDVAKRRVETQVGSVNFDDGAIYPRIRGAKLLEAAGIMDAESKQREARIDPAAYHVPDDDRVFVAGDARPMPFPKSGFVANAEAYYVANLVARRIKGGNGAPAPFSGTGMCYVAMNTDPLRSIAFKVGFGWNADASGKRAYHQTAESLGNPSEPLGKANIQWGRSLYSEMFS